VLCSSDVAVPDWICEIVSPSTERLDRFYKLKIYNREGVTHVWLVNPLQRTLEVLRLEQGRWIVAGARGGEEHVVTVEPFDAVPLALSRIWPA
jgi:Uma2 family endonuclease